MTPEQTARVAYRAGFRGHALCTAVAVAMAESGGNPSVKGDVGLQDGTWGPSVGLWQIRSLNAERGQGTTRDELANDNPLHNARAAWAISRQGRSFQPWTMYTNGGYRAHLGAARRAAAAVEGDARDGELKGARAMGGGAIGRRGNGTGDARVESRRKGRPATRRSSGGPGRSGTVTISIPELTRLASGLGGHQAAVSASRGRLLGAAQQLELLQGQVDDPAPVRAVLATLAELTGERPMGTVTMPRIGRQLSTDVEIVTRCRDLVRRADDGSLGAMPAASVAKILREAKAHGATLSVLAVLEAALLGKLAGKKKAGRHVTAPAGPNRPRRPAPARPAGGGGATARERKVKRLIALARKQVGLRDGGNNNTKFGRWYGWNHAAWCAMFVSWCFAKAKLPLADLQPGDPSKTGFAGVALGAESLKRKGMLHTRPKAGDIVLYRDNGGHTGIVTSVSADGKTYRTVEGNAGPASDRVIERSHRIGDRPVYGFGRPL